MHFLVILALVSRAVTVFSNDCPPDTCNPDETCCTTGISGVFSCCPLENAVCCGDHHCCPEGTECDVTTGSCQTEVNVENELGNLDVLEKRQGELEEEMEEEVTSEGCKMGTCDESETCCPTGTPGDFGCCPYTNAVCCETRTFCCPEDTECDVLRGECNPTEGAFETKLEKRQGLVEENSELRCIDGSTCSPDTTCCKVVSGHYGCCPHLEATCCLDGIHCCPRGEYCDLTSNWCIGRMAHPSSMTAASDSA